MSDTQIRWMVRLEPSRELKFGEHPRDVLKWAVTRYIGRTVDGQIRAVERPTFFQSRMAAHLYAQRQERHHYRQGAQR